MKFKPFFEAQCHGHDPRSVSSRSDTSALSSIPTLQHRSWGDKWQNLNKAENITGILTRELLGLTSPH